MIQVPAQVCLPSLLRSLSLRESAHGCAASNLIELQQSIPRYDTSVHRLLRCSLFDDVETFHTGNT